MSKPFLARSLPLASLPIRFLSARSLSMLLVIASSLALSTCGDDDDDDDDNTSADTDTSDATDDDDSDANDDDATGDDDDATDDDDDATDDDDASNDDDSDDDDATDDDDVIELPNEIEGCDGAKLFEKPAALADPGPWAVGARTIELAGLTTEVWYPAQPGAERGLEKTRYDIREALPPRDQSKIPDDQNPWQNCDCYRDLPPDSARGPYPVILYVHGTAAFRTQQLNQATHWASRGFIVIAADHRWLYLADALQFKLNPDPGSDIPTVSLQIRNLLAAIKDPASYNDGAPLDFLTTIADTSRLAAIGHSRGGGEVGALADEPNVRVIAPLSSGGIAKSADLTKGDLESTLVMAGETDGIVAYDNSFKGYEASPSPKRFVGLVKAGHLAFSELCSLGADRGGILQIAIDNGIDVNQLIASLATDGCTDDDLAPELGWKIINEATAAVFEETLHCDSSRADALRTAMQADDNVLLYEEDFSGSTQPTGDEP